MKPTRLTAVVCFVIAAVLYVIGGSSPVDGVFFGIGVTFELAGWKHLFKQNE